jgi:hypothetical protein
MHGYMINLAVMNPKVNCLRKLIRKKTKTNKWHNVKVLQIL